MTLRTKRERIAASNHYRLLYGDGQATPMPERRERKQDRLIPTEHQIQCSVIAQWFLMCGNYGLPHYSLFAIPNGGARDPITGARLKSEGVRAGVPDLQLAVKRGAHAGLFIELKRPGGKTSDSQNAVLEYLCKAGYSAVVCFEAEEAINTIRAYLAQ